MLQALLLFQLREVEFADSRLQVHVFAPHKGGFVPEFVGDVADEDHRHRQIGLEEILRQRRGPGERQRAWCRRWCKADPELRHQDQDVEEQAEPGADKAGLGFEGEIIERVALQFPRLSEAYVCKTDRAPREDRREPAEGLHPDESLFPRARRGKKGEKPKGTGQQDREDRPPLAIDISEDSGRLPLLGQCRNCA